MLPTQNEIETIYKKIWGATAQQKKNIQNFRGSMRLRGCSFGLWPLSTCQQTLKTFGNPKQSTPAMVEEVLEPATSKCRWFSLDTLAICKVMKQLTLITCISQFLLSHHLLLHLKFLDHLYFWAGTSYTKIMDLDFWLVSKPWAFQIAPGPKLLAFKKLEKRGE